MNSMSKPEPNKLTNLDHYGFPPLLWSRAHSALVTGSPSPSATFFLGTVGPDGTPHAAGVGGLWQDNLYFTSGPRMRKARDLAANPPSTVSARLPDIDLVLEGRGDPRDGRPALEQIAARSRRGGCPAQVYGDALTAPFQRPSAGQPPVALVPQ
jgi:hypothetical protein